MIAIQRGLWALCLLSIVCFARWLHIGDDIFFGFRLDLLSSLMFMMVAALGAVIAQYSVRYLSGEARQTEFFVKLLLTVLSVCCVMLSSNLLMLFVFWIATSLCLHQLLVFFGNRPGARLAARKKFVISRVGDLALLVAIVLIYQQYGTFDFNELFAATRTQGSQNQLIGLLLTMGALTKSAQVPFHFWLPETMESPTPVSALMHAGIINAGGFLMIRMSPVMSGADGAQVLLIATGAITAAYGALVMITQNDIKKKLAYSTISQMGVMMLACGMGAFSLALFHMIAHSFYKAHAFLSTGALVEESKKVDLFKSQAKPLVFVGACVVGALAIAYASIYDSPHMGHATYIAILILGLAQNTGSLQMSSRVSKIHLLIRVGTPLLLAIAMCVFVEATVHNAMAPLLPASWGAHLSIHAKILLSFFVYGLFCLVFYLTSRLKQPRSSALIKLYMFFWNDAYLGVLVDRLLNRERKVQLARS